MIDPITQIILEKETFINEVDFITQQPGFEGLVGLAGPLKDLSRGELSKMFLAGGVILGGLIVVYAYAAYKVVKNRNSKHCMKLKGIQKDICMLKVRIKGKTEQLSKLKKGLSICSKSKNSDKCKAKINQKIIKVNNELKKIQKAMKQN